MILNEPHLSLLTNALKRWNQLIQDGNATMIECLETVIEDLLVERRCNEVRKKGKISKSIMPSS